MDKVKEKRWIDCRSLNHTHVHLWMRQRPNWLTLCCFTLVVGDDVHPDSPFAHIAHRIFTNLNAKREADGHGLDVLGFIKSRGRN